MRKNLLASALLTVLANFPASAAIFNRCTYPDATYKSPRSHLRLSFVNIGRQHELVSDLALRIVEPRTNKIFWYYFDQGSAPKVSLISTTDVTKRSWRPNPDGGDRPYGSATFIGLNKNGTILYDAPSSKSRATEYIIIPELAEVFKSIRLWGIDANAFVLSACRPTHHKD